MERRAEAQFEIRNPKSEMALLSALTSLALNALRLPLSALLSFKFANR